jgi:hypothetical protein
MAALATRRQVIAVAVAVELVLLVLLVQQAEMVEQA